MTEVLGAPLDGFRQTLEAVHQAGGLVIGSVGRAAIFGHRGLNPLIEFETRGEKPLAKPSGEPRDIDIIGEYGLHWRLKNLPHPVDGAAFTMTSRTVAQDSTGQWWFIGFRGQGYRFSEECFTPIEASVCGVPCRTVRPATHMALAYPHGKYRAGYDILSQNLPADEADFLDSGAYGPLWTLHDPQP